MRANRIRKVHWGRSGLIMLGLCACGPSGIPVQASNVKAPSAELYGVVFEGFAGGRREVEVHAVRADVDPTDRMVRLHKVRIDFEATSRGNIEIEAERGRLSLDSDDFWLDGEVVGHTSQGDRFTTARVRYDRRRELISTSEAVDFHRPSLQLQGEGMELHVPSRRFRLLARVRARWEPK